MEMSKTMLALLMLAGSPGAALAQTDDSLDSLLGAPAEPAPPPANASTTAPEAAASDSTAKPEAPSAAAASGSEPAAAAAEAVPATGDTVPVAAANGAAAAGPVKHSSRSRLVEEIVVTATKREESISDVPIAISAFSADKLDALGVKSANQLSKITPGLTFTTSAGYPQIYLRGVGSDAFLPSADATVPVYLDGVALLGGHGVSNTLGRVSRVEVVKGPQGTLFGRNSTGGAISIVTPDPSDSFEGDVQTEFGNRGTFNTLLYVNLPVTEDLGVTLSGFNEVHDTYVQNDQGPAPTVASYSRGGRGKVVWHALDNLSFNASALYEEESSNAGTGSFQNTRVSLPFRAIVRQDPKLDYHNQWSVIGDTVLYSTIFNGGFDWKLPWVEFKGIGSTQKQNNTSISFDYDGSPSALINFDGNNEFFEQSTGELQILSTPDTPLAKYFTWVAGAYYLTGNGGFPDLNLKIGGSTVSGGLLGQLVPAIGNLITNLGITAGIPLVNEPITAVSGGLINSQSLSGYFQGTTLLSEIFGLNQRLNLITGFRIDKETRGLTDNRLAVVNPITQNQITALTFNVPNITAVQVPLKLGLQWFPADAQQIYASFSRGFTAPTYSTVNFFSAPPPLQAQKVNSYEVGTKLQFLDGALSVNAAAFYIQEKNLLTGFAGLTSGGIVEFENVPAARVRGLELDFVFSPLPELDPGFAVLGSASYLDAKYTSYPNGRGYDVTTGLAFGPPEPIFGIPLTTLPARDFTGNDITRTPNFTYNVGINQSIPLGDDSRIELNVATNYSSRYYNDSQNASVNETPSFQLLDASVSYFYKPWGIQVTGYGTNLTGVIYPASVFLLDTGRFQSPNDPRLYGLRLKYTFGPST